ncbi:MAG: DNA polymerase III subunit delta [Thermodesulfobacteriota bacterium]
MAVYQRKDTRKLLQEIEKGLVHPVYLLHGDRYLCRKTGDELIAALSKENREYQVNIRRMDGEKEDPVQTVNLLKSYSLFNGRQIVRVMDSGLLSSRTNSSSFWDRALKAHADNDREVVVRCLSRLLDLADLESCAELAGLTADQWRKSFGFTKPGNIEWLNDITINREKTSTSKEDRSKELVSFLENGTGLSCGNILVLISEEVDKRKKLYRTIDQQGAIIDLSVPAGENAAARKEKESVIREIISGTLQEMGKKAGPGVLENMVRRVGFHPVAAALETEKLSLFCDDKDVINVSDLEAVVGKTREEAIYELNEAVADLDLSRSLLLIGRLRDRGFHPLAINSGLRKMFRKFLYIRFLQEQSDLPYTPGQSYKHFQKDYLNRLKNSQYAESVFLKGHPYSLYRSFRQTEKLSGALLKKGLKKLLKTEYRLKGSGVKDDLVMDDFLFFFLTGQEVD